jgi:hypothetical protein
MDNLKWIVDAIENDILILFIKAIKRIINFPLSIFNVVWPVSFLGSGVTNLPHP